MQQNAFSGASTVQYSGYQINQKGAKPVPEKVTTIVSLIVNCPKPKTIAELRRFLLNAFLHAAKKNDKRLIVWTEEAEIAFKKCKGSQTALLDHSKINSPSFLITDASNLACGAALQQKINGLWEPIAFFSKKFSPQEINIVLMTENLLQFIKQ